MLYAVSNQKPWQLLKNHHTKPSGITQVELLHESGITINPSPDYPTDGIYLEEKAVFDNNLEMLKTIIRLGGSPEAVGYNGRLLLQLAIYQEATEIFQYLIQFESLINKPEFVKYSFERNESYPLHAAAIAGKAEYARDLLTNGAKINVRDKLGNTPLHYAVLKSEVDTMVALLSAEGIDLQSQNINGQTPLELGQARLNSDHCDCSASVALLKKTLK